MVLFAQAVTSALTITPEPAGGAIAARAAPTVGWVAHRTAAGSHDDVTGRTSTGSLPVVAL